MKYLIISIYTAAIVLQQPQEGTMRIHSDGFNNNNGKAKVLLYRKEDIIPDKPYKTITADITEYNSADFEIPNLPFSNYAIIVWHDENNNGHIDHILGLPDEQLGYSNGWQLDFFSGMPTFSKLEFMFNSLTQIHNVPISYKK